MSLLMAGRLEEFLIVLLCLLGSSSSAYDNPAPSKNALPNGGMESGTLFVSGLAKPRKESGKAARAPAFGLKTEQLTFGTKNHFFGYIGQCRTIPWNDSGRYILGMEIDRIDRMPEAEDAATIITRTGRASKTGTTSPSREIRKTMTRYLGSVMWRSASL